MAENPQEVSRTRRVRFRWLCRLEAELEPLMFLLAIAWIWLFIDELVSGLSLWQENAIFAIWIAFIFEFLLKLYLAPRRLKYLLRNWITAIALIVPAFRAFRMLRALRVLRATRIASTTRIVRALTSSRRFYKDLKEAQGPAPTPEMNVGLLVIASPATPVEALEQFAAETAETIRQELDDASRLRWCFHTVKSRRLESDSPKQPSDFLDEASLGMAQGPHDMIIVVTDVTLVSHERKVQEGLASPTARIAVVSTRKLTTAPRGKPQRGLEAMATRANASALLLHLIGHLAGLRHERSSEVMQPFAFRESRDALLRFNAGERKWLTRISKRLPERELHGKARLAAFLFHVLMAARHPMQVLRPLLRNKAPLLPLSLPGLATAAVAPCFLLVFTAEIWDVGLGMSNAVAAIYAILSILGATLFLANVQSLFLPRKERNVLTEHLAVANAVIFLSILLACIGLFLIVGALILAIEVYIFPADLMNTWPTLDRPEVDLGDKLRLSAFIATVGVSTGALAGGFESRTVIRNLALFESES
ncbi:MAG TPA: hypothetical protein VF275_07405 [Gammaproteobacteria bacterium]